MTDQVPNPTPEQLEDVAYELLGMQPESERVPGTEAKSSGRPSLHDLAQDAAAEFLAAATRAARGLTEATEFESSASRVFRMTRGIADSPGTLTAHELSSGAAAIQSLLASAERAMGFAASLGRGSGPTEITFTGKVNGTMDAEMASLLVEKPHVEAAPAPKVPSQPATAQSTPTEVSKSTGDLADDVVRAALKLAHTAIDRRMTDLDEGQKLIEIAIRAQAIAESDRDRRERRRVGRSRSSRRTIDDKAAEAIGRELAKTTYSRQA